MKIIQDGAFHAHIDDNGNAELFSYWGNVADVVVPSELLGYKVTKLGEKLFAYHREIESIILPHCLETIGKDVFVGCRGLKNPIILPENIRKIGANAFNSYVFPTIELPSKLEIIGCGAFENSKLTEITFPVSIKEIKGKAFSGTLINHVIIPDSVTMLYGDSFDECRNLSSISIGAGVKDGFKYSALHDCPKLKDIHISTENEYLCIVDGVLYDKEITRLIKYPAIKSAEVFLIPETVTKICSKAFEYTKIDKVICPNGLKEISDDAFINSSLRHINIPNCIEWISITNCFREDWWNCFPDGVTYEISENSPNYELIDGKLSRKKAVTNTNYIKRDISEKTSGMFGYCEFTEQKATITRILETPKKLVLPKELDGLTVCGILERPLEIFYRYCPKSIYLPETFEKAFTGNMFFCDNDLIEHIDVADNNPNIFSKDGVLYQKAKPNTQTDNYTTLSCYPMRRHSFSKTYRIPDCTEKIGEFAFYHLKYIKRVIIPPNVKLIYCRAFSNCLSLEEVWIEDNCEAVIYASAFCHNKKLKKIVIPKSVQKINDDAVNIYQSPKPVIYGVKDSAAEYFAAKNKLVFASI
ncbi:leucine-rich repeat domain-containing protein [Anaerosporobacter sp.]|uniref:leucine-rich repeat domain-containing protein n=1 Tax=Anaerosporobacter sp. TaxID=1872529 RepID=UPI00286F0C48|nr:leucine-rich repeat domain-containing protein [Anaerosporobacter sp.]